MRLAQPGALLLALAVSSSSWPSLVSGASLFEQLARRDVTTSSEYTTLSQSQADEIKSILNNIADKSWEMGTHAQALLEFDYPALSVFNASFTSIRNQDSSASSPPPTEVLDIASSALSQKEQGSLMLMPDGSAADPAAVAVAVLLANYTATSEQDRASYGQAADDEIEYLLQVAPRSEAGAISHRAEQVQLWADFVYMVPPYLAYYGAMRENQSLVEEAHTQCMLYRSVLRQNGGLWAHILMGDQDTQDAGLWATGNAWAAAGMLRVAATIDNSQYASDLASERDDLVRWASEIIDAAFTRLNNDGLLPDYLDEQNPTADFGDAASTALMTGTAYRLAAQGLGNMSLASAESARLAVLDSIGSDGVLAPVVDPLSFAEVDSDASPEGQAFVLIMHSSFGAWLNAGGASIDQQPPENAATTKASSQTVSALLAAAVTVCLVTAAF